MNETDLLNLIINRLIFSNMRNGIEPLSLSINFGVYELKFQGDEKSTLRQAVDFFEKEIKTIMVGKNEHQRDN